MRQRITQFYKTAPTIGLVNDRQRYHSAKAQKSSLQHVVKMSDVAVISSCRRQHHSSTAAIVILQASAQAAPRPREIINPHSVRCTA